MVVLVVLGGIVGPLAMIRAVSQDAAPAATPCATRDAAANEAPGRAFFTVLNARDDVQGAEAMIARVDSLSD